MESPPKIPCPIDSPTLWLLVFHLFVAQSIIVMQFVEAEKESVFELSTRSKAFLGWVGFIMVVAATMTIERISYSIRHHQGVKYSVLVLILILFSTYLAISAVWKENPWELGSFMLISCVVMAFVVFQFAIGDKSAVIWVRFAVTVCCVPITLICAAFVWKDFGWRIYKTIGADTNLQRIYGDYIIFVSCLKVDIMLGILLITMAGFFAAVPPWEMDLDILAMAVQLFWAVVGWRGMKMENNRAMHFFFVLSVLEPGYLIWKACGFLMDFSSRPPPDGWLGPFLMAAVLALIIRGVLLWRTWVCWVSFQQGLKGVEVAPSRKSMSRSFVEEQEQRLPLRRGDEERGSSTAVQ